MVKIRKWLKQTFDNLVDPDRDGNIQDLHNKIYYDIHQLRDQFELSRSIVGLPGSEKHLAAAKESVYRSVVGPSWAKGDLSPKQQQTAKWLARKLELPSARMTSIDFEYARNAFANALAKAMEDGNLDQEEQRYLDRIASVMDLPAAAFAREFFRLEGERFLRGMFLAAIEDGVLEMREWQQLIDVTEKLGVTADELRQVIEPQARMFVEHVLADAKADEVLSEQEIATIRWLLAELRPDPQFSAYVEGQVRELTVIADAAEGILPSLKPPPNVEIRPGEIVHYLGNAQWKIVRNLKSGRRVDQHFGRLLLTDNRLLFISETKSQSMTYRRVVSHSGDTGRIRLQLTGKPATSFYTEEDSLIPYTIFETAVALANQTKAAKLRAGKPSRHIPRDVRQRVWQRYGGRCAECDAQDYLEFDHIIPVAKGGSNGDSNIQLLCRRCNLKKSDNI